MASGRERSSQYTGRPQRQLRESASQPGAQAHSNTGYDWRWRRWRSDVSTIPGYS